jgi:hypothetical protein
MKQHALEHFRRPPQRLNCAQSVLYAYQQVAGVNSIPLSDMKSLGGGRAPGGLCGAVHAACVVAPSRAESLKKRFAEITGSIYCAELRSAAEHPCEVCVSESARLLGDELGLA